MSLRESKGQMEARQQGTESKYNIVRYYTSHSLTRNLIGCSVMWDISAFLERLHRTIFSWNSLLGRKRGRNLSVGL